MAKSGAAERAAARGKEDRDSGYFAWSRDPAVGLFAVLPLWLLYEGLRLTLTPAERNGAEALLLDTLALVGTGGMIVLRTALGVGVAVAAASLVRRKIPWLRVAAVSALEGSVYGLLLGPIASALATEAYRMLDAGAVLAAANPDRLAADLVGSLGAGVFEELVFRLCLMSALAWLWVRATRGTKVPPWLGGALAVAISALVFAWFHHLCGEPFDPSSFVFRTVAGVLLGLLFWFRGFGVCVYAHAFYDVVLYATRA